MENRVQSIVSRENKSVKIGVIPGHFATNHSHVNYYIDMTAIKSQHKMAESGAAVLAEHYRTVTPVDTIICLEGTEMLGGLSGAGAVPVRPVHERGTGHLRHHTGAERQQPDDFSGTTPRR